MPINYLNLARQIALQADQITGGDAAARLAAYTDSDLSAQMDGVELPYKALKQMILVREKELAAAVGNSDNVVLRASLMAESDDMTDGDEISISGSGTSTFVGVYDGVFDAIDGKACTEQPVQVVRRRRDQSFWKIPVYYFCLQGTIIQHTRDIVVMRGCAWDAVAQDGLFDSAGDSPLPQELEGLFADMVLAGMAQEGWFLEEAGWFAERAVATWNKFFPGQKMPDTTARRNPVKD